MSVTINLDGKVALVTGASRGIGAAIATVLHQAGATVLINHPDSPDGQTRHDAETLRDTLLALRPASAGVFAADVRDPAAVSRMMDEARDDWGGLDILVNNAGILRDRSIGEMSPTDWDDVIGINLSGVFHVCKFGLPILRDGGAIVNISSLSAEAGFHGQANYAAAKAGVEGLSRVLARECARRSIRVNAVAPGLVDTPMAAAIPAEARAKLEASIPAARLARPEEIAAAVLFLASPLASYISGEVLGVDGGWRG